jgi:redox-sensitive bicupin YhaK (pirin superfamily)
VNRPISVGIDRTREDGDVGVAMSWRPTADPTETPVRAPADADAVEALLTPRDRDLGGFAVRRLLPASRHRTVGPFVFFDHFGPTDLAPGQGMDVRPHPHINLATVTYLFAGEIVHRDSLGSLQPIRPGDINWMTAGRGIVHSERTAAALRATGSIAHGLQLWVGLPRADEETAPAFHHHPADSLPALRQGGAEIRVLAGEAFGRRSPVATFSRLAYVDVRLEAGATIELPDDAGDRGAYVVEGEVTCGAERCPRWHMLLLRAGHRALLRADAPSRFVLLAGDRFPEPRHIWWNFVSSSEARIEQAKRDWRERRGAPDGPFPLVPGDEQEFMPLPDK